MIQQNQKKFLLILILFSILIFENCFITAYGHRKRKHECVHDEKTKNQKYYVTGNPQNTNRKLQEQGTPEPLRVTFNFDQLDNDYLTNQNIPAPTASTKQQLVNFIKKQAEAATQYVSKILKVVRLPNITYPDASYECGITTIPQVDLLGRTDSDLNIYVTYDYAPNEYYLAYASFCILSITSFYRPIFGYINYNLGYQDETNVDDPLEFKEQLETTIHELTHVLGFSGYAIQYYWYDRQAGQRYFDGNISKALLFNQSFRGTTTTNLVVTPSIKEFARRYYNCPVIVGMQLENGGSAGSAGSHWERLAIKNEYMTASAVNNAKYSNFTLSLLNDTGWYDVVDFSFADDLSWGKGKGCAFFQQGCKDTTTNYSEFSKVSGESKCSFDFSGYGVNFAGDIFADGCQYIYEYSNTGCTKTSNINDDYWAFGNEITPFVYFNWDSRCFQSTVLPSGYSSQGYNFRCYKYKCNKDQNILSIILNEQTILNCTQNAQVLSVPGYSGNISCPLSITQFCRIPDLCPNFCSANGICLNEKCHCLSGYTGFDCGLQCLINQVNDQGQCADQCPEGFVPNPINKVCVQESACEGDQCNNNGGEDGGNENEGERKFECKHDTNFYLRPQRVQETPFTPSSRNGKQPQPFRFTYEFTSQFLATVGNTTSAINNIKYMNQTLLNIQRYLNNLLKVFYEGPNSSTIINNMWKGGSSCMTYVVNTTKYNSPNGVKSSDLHVFIHSDIENVDFVGVACSWLGQGSSHPDRPNYGIFTLPYDIASDMKNNVFSFAIKRTVYYTVLHQLFHILGLSKSEYSYWHKNDNSYYTNEELYALLSNIPQDPQNPPEIPPSKHVFLKTPSLQAASFKHFAGGVFPDPKFELKFASDSQNIEKKQLLGAALENNQETNYDGQDELLQKLSSHWEQTTTYGELMNAAGFLNQWYVPVVSIFTLSALKDSGYYADVNLQLAEYLSFGSDRGLEFQFQGCHSHTFNESILDENNQETIVYREAEFAQDTEEYDCDFYGTGFSKGRETLYTDDGCYLRVPDDQLGNCLRDDTQNFDFSSKPQQRFLTFDFRGPNSRCYKSDYSFKFDGMAEITPDQLYRCFNTSSNILTLKGVNEPNPQIIPNPEQQFCKISNNCSEEQGENLNVGGAPIQGQNDNNMPPNFNPYLKINIGSYSLLVNDSTESVFANPVLQTPFYDGQLIIPKKKKFQSYYVSTDCPNSCSFNGFCIRSKGCQCNAGFGGPDCSQSITNQSTICKNLKLAYDIQSGQCLSKCYDGTYNASNVCIQCPMNCQKCINATNCAQCFDGFIFENGQCVPSCQGPPFSYQALNKTCQPCPQRIPSAQPLGCQYCYRIGEIACVQCFKFTNFAECLDS